MLGKSGILSFLTWILTAEHARTVEGVYVLAICNFLIVLILKQFGTRQKCWYVVSWGIVAVAILLRLLAGTIIRVVIIVKH